MLRRFIPAYAGNSEELNKREEKMVVHPRLRGELPLNVRKERLRHGSSPLTRGTRSRHSAPSSRHRFIPAYAGNSKAIPKNNVRYYGSSPLTRGTRIMCCRLLGILRFIPAYAGNSNTAATSEPPMPVHPRLRGELRKIHRSRQAADGSSPLTRGTQHQF